jgi:hypothetical protein
MESWIDSWQGQDICLYKAPKQAVGPTLPPTKMLWELYVRVERL